MNFIFFFFFFNDTATTEIYTSVHTLSLHDALPIRRLRGQLDRLVEQRDRLVLRESLLRSEEHTFELQSRTLSSYAVFCLKKKKKYRTLQGTDTTHQRPSSGTT